jgi:LPS export ABC transporter protein LptC
MRRAKAAILMTIILIGGIVFVSLCKTREKRGAGQEAEIPKLAGDDSKMHLEKVQFVEDKQGRRTWELEAKSVRQYEDQDLVVLEDVKVTVFTKEGRSFVLSGKQARLHQASKDMELEGDVLLTSSDGYRLKTRSIAYRHGEKKAQTADPVEIEGEELRVKGNGMVVDIEARTFQILNQVRTQWRQGGKG